MIVTSIKEQMEALLNLTLPSWDELCEVADRVRREGMTDMELAGEHINLY